MLRYFPKNHPDSLDNCGFYDAGSRPNQIHYRSTYVHRRLFKPTIGIFDRRFNRRQLIWQLFTDFVSQRDQFSSQNIITVSIGRRQQLEDSPQTATDSSQTARRQFASQTAHKLSADNLQTARRQFTDSPQTPPDSSQTPPDS